MAWLQFDSTLALAAKVRRYGNDAFFNNTLRYGHLNADKGLGQAHHRSTIGSL
jgi:hypothetical protein